MWKSEPSQGAPVHREDAAQSQTHQATQSPVTILGFFPGVERSRAS